MKQVAAAIIEREGHFLVARRAHGEKLAGFWEFPGGKLLPGESPQECVVRELWEEFAINVSAGAILMQTQYSYPEGSINLIAVEGSMVEQPLTLTVHDASLWLSPPDLIRLELAPADIPVANELARRHAVSSRGSGEGN